MALSFSYLPFRVRSIEGVDWATQNVVIRFSLQIRFTDLVVPKHFFKPAPPTPTVYKPRALMWEFTVFWRLIRVDYLENRAYLWKISSSVLQTPVLALAAF